jgi:DNA mismatch repair protein MutL
VRVTTSRIAVLSPELADQIAAGEVVERPASVVKELCENSIDAGARRIEIDVDGGGRRFIRVADDGGGMTPDEARLALRRHATSKIRSADDLWGLATFGFRGEALPSIAAVSRLTLATKVAGAPAGFRLTVEAGIETDAREVGIPDGTQIEIRDLFFNTPARLKFQKTESTEAANVNEAVLRLALGHPNVHFRLRAAGRQVLDLPAHRELGERVRAAFARRGAGALHEARGSEGGHDVRAFLAAPEEAATTARSTFLFVGRRFIRDRSLLHALALGYGALLEKGRYPLAALFLDVPGSDLDINVHPQKLEVRFARAAEAYAAVRHVVAGGVAQAPWLPPTRGTLRVHTLPPSPRFEGGGEGGTDAPPAQMGFRPRVAPGLASTGEPPWSGVAAGYRAAEAPTELDTAGGGAWRRERVSPAPGRDDTPVADAAFAVPAALAGEAYFQSLAYIGQLNRTYLICESAGELVLIDQHAAHERIAFERLRAAHGRREIRRQRLLFPVPVEIDSDDAPPLTDGSPADVHDALQALGFDVEPLPPPGAPASPAGVRRVLVRAVPELLRDADPKPLLRDVLAQLAEDGGLAAVDASSRRIDNVLATMACHSVVRAGDVLARPQALALLSQLDAVDLRSHCPHGRPILLRLPLAEIERRFGRA